MSYSKRSRYSRSPSPYDRYGRSRSSARSLSRSISRSRSRSRDERVENPGNNLYVTGLSPRITKKEIEKHFLGEGTVVDVHLVVDPWTRESRGFGFVTMSTVEEADRCIKYLDGSVLEGRVITVEKARRRRGRTPTPGRYLGLKTVRVRHRSPSYSPYRRSHSTRFSSERDRSRSRSYSPSYSSEHDRGRSYSPYYRRRRYHSRSRSPFSRSPFHRRDRSYSPYYDRRDHYYTPYHSRRDRAYSPYDSGYDSLDDREYHRRHRGRYCSISRSISPRSSYRRYRSVSRSISPRSKRSHQKYRSVSRSISPRSKRSYRSYSHSISHSPRRSGSASDSFSRSCSRSPSVRPSSKSVSRSNTPESSSPSS